MSEVQVGTGAELEVVRLAEALEDWVILAIEVDDASELVVAVADIVELVVVPVVELAVELIVELVTELADTAELVLLTVDMVATADEVVS